MRVGLPLRPCWCAETSYLCQWERCQTQLDTLLCAPRGPTRYLSLLVYKDFVQQFFHLLPQTIYFNWKWMRSDITKLNLARNSPQLEQGRHDYGLSHWTKTLWRGCSYKLLARQTACKFYFITRQVKANSQVKWISWNLGCKLYTLTLCIFCHHQK